MKYSIQLKTEASTATLDNLLKDPVGVKFDCFPNYTADVLIDNGKEVAGVEGS